MIKVLILAYDFPPYVSVGGLRPYSWYEYFHEYNISPIVITRQWDNKHGNYLDYVEISESKKTIIEETIKGKIIRTSYKPNLANKLLLKYGERKFRFVRKLISAFYEFAQWIIPIGPKLGLFYEAKNYLRYNNVDLIIATGDPFILFLYANKLSKMFSTPWIADYRDPWTNGATIDKNRILAFFLSFYEKKIIRTATAVITVSDFFSTRISRVVKRQNFNIIPNGYNPDVISKCENVRQERNCLNIGFAGTILEFETLIIFLETLNNYKKDHAQFNFKLNFYGTNRNEDLIELLHNKYDYISPYCFIYPKVNNDKLLPTLAKYNTLLLFNYHKSIGTKIYDYIALKRKIIFCFQIDNSQKRTSKSTIGSYSNSPQIELIKKTNSGIIVKNKEHLLEVLNDLYKEFSETGQIACHSKDISEYSRKAQTEKLANLIKSIVVK